MEDGACKSLIDIHIGDLLWNNVKVVGIVEINGLTVNKLYEYDLPLDIVPNLGKMHIICSDNLYYIDDFGKNVRLDSFHKKEIPKQEKLYHLLTSSSYFYIQHLKISDYNSCIDMKI